MLTKSLLRLSREMEQNSQTVSYEQLVGIFAEEEEKGEEGVRGGRAEEEEKERNGTGK